MSSIAGVHKLFSKSHEFLTKPVNGLSYLGMSDWAIRYFVAFTFARFDYNPKTLFAYYNSEQIGDFLRKIEGETKLSPHQQLYKHKFWINQGEPVTVFETKEYDVEFCAPVDLRIVDINTELWKDFRQLPKHSWIFKV